MRKSIKSLVACTIFTVQVSNQFVQIFYELTKTHGNTDYGAVLLQVFSIIEEQTTVFYFITI